MGRGAGESDPAVTAANDAEEEARARIVCGCKTTTWRKVFTILGVLFASGLIVWLLGRVLAQPLFMLLEIIRKAGAIGYVAYFFLYVVATVLLVPGSILTIGAGFIYGLYVGTAIVSVSSTTGATCAFLLGQRLLRERVERYLERKFPDWKKLDAAVRENGAVMVFLLRLSPALPFNVLNYALGTANLTTWQYLPSSWIGLLPGTILYVWIGTTLSSLSGANGRTFTPEEQIFSIVGLVFTLGLVIAGTIWARKQIRQRVDQANEHAAASGDSAAAAAAKEGIIDAAPDRAFVEV